MSAMLSPREQTPWFAVSMGLVGFIVGFALAMSFSGNLSLGGGKAAPTVAGTPTPPPAPTAPTPPAPPSNPATPDDDIVLGKADAPITLIEFADFQCPFCQKFFNEAYASIKKEYIDTGKVKLVYRDYPLPFHPNAKPAAIAMECVREQSEKLAWEFHDVVYAKQDQLTAENIKAWGEGLSGINKAKYNDCITSQKYASEVDKDMADGSAAGVGGTPSFWVLGPKGKTDFIEGAYPFDRFKQAFDGMLQ
jgi:protein-disulfide isomerase